MKELSIEEKAKRYDKAIIRAKSLIGDTIIEETGQHIAEVLFPELAESEDERIRKALIDYFRWNLNNQLLNEFTNREVFAWLEKQVSLKDIVDRHKDSWYNEGKIAGMAEGLTDDEKYQQGWHDALEKQGEQNPAWSEEDEDMFNDVIIDLKIFRDKDPGEAGKAAYQREIDWLKSLKERIV
ncbi:hypothetical protein, partial [Sharpea azabuensis]|uniref:hypothetical protein n=1 Tax=Sharpea azabuensis TaxID=322505 RepID=UPI002E810CD6